MASSVCATAFELISIPSIATTGQPVAFEMLDVSLFVLGATLGEHLKDRVPDFRLLQRAVGNRQIKARQVAAIKMPHQSDALK